MQNVREICMIVPSLFWECIFGHFHCYRSCLLVNTYQINFTADFVCVHLNSDVFTLCRSFPLLCSFHFSMSCAPVTSTTVTYASTIYLYHSCWYLKSTTTVYKPHVARQCLSSQGTSMYNRVHEGCWQLWLLVKL